MKYVRNLTLVLTLLSAPALAQDPEALNRFRTGYELMQKRSYRNAAIELEQAVAIDTSYGNAHYVLAQAYKVLNEYDKAIASFSAARALGTKPERAARELGQLYHKAAISSFGQKKYRAAIGYFQNALEFNPQNAKAHYALGLSCLLYTSPSPRDRG